MNVLESMRENHIKKIIYASSSCYGLQNFPTKETDNIDTHYPYSFLKILVNKSFSTGQKFMILNIFPQIIQCLRFEDHEHMVLTELRGNFFKTKIVINLSQ